MIRPTAILKTSARSTRMLVRVRDEDVLKAALMPSPTPHPRAVPMLLEALSLWHQAPVRVVLCAKRSGIVVSAWPARRPAHQSRHGPLHRRGPRLLARAAAANRRRR